MSLGHRLTQSLKTGNLGLAQHPGLLTPMLSSSKTSEKLHKYVNLPQMSASQNLPIKIPRPLIITSCMPNHTDPEEK